MATGTAPTITTAKHTGGRDKPLSQAELKQRRDAAKKSAERRRKNKEAKKTRNNALTGARSGDGDPNAPGYVSAERFGEIFREADVDGSQLNIRRDAKSGFMTFSGKDGVSHKRFVDSLRKAGFLVQTGADGSGIAINSAGQAVMIKPASDGIGVQDKRRKAKTRTLGRNQLP